jgi:hypothetical protein
MINIIESREKKVIFDILTIILGLGLFRPIFSFYRAYLFIIKNVKMSSGVQVLECLSSKCEALSSNPTTHCQEIWNRKL